MGGVEHAEAPVHGVPELLELREHAVVGDPPPVGLLDDGASSQEQPLQPWRGVGGGGAVSLLGFLEEEGDEPADEVTGQSG